MAAKTTTEVLIAGKVYKLGGYETEEFYQRIASYINNKIVESSGLDGYNKLPTDMKATLLQLNIAEDLFNTKKKLEGLESNMADKEKALYDLKHELISMQLKMEEMDKKIKSLEEENHELQLNKARLETSLEDALFGKKQ
ncbi:MAG: cell division protein ZapA [Lachnospiraceae bacterium]|nr:cell division protein ZapA [Lachnospiraceae bacterium]